ncbi:MAG TPA: hypothetical protein VFG20_06445, partial [Planctomycetaceae bacterium]|nr:hypothetical protein [Planctomycetaceae bacterium]
MARFTLFVLPLAFAVSMGCQQTAPPQSSSASRAASAAVDAAEPVLQPVPTDNTAALSVPATV